MEYAAAIGAFLSENAGAIGAGAAIAGAGTGIYSASQAKKGGSKMGPASVPGAQAATLSDAEKERRRLAARVSSALTKGWAQPTLGQAGLLGA